MWPCPTSCLWGGGTSLHRPRTVKYVQFASENNRLRNNLALFYFQLHTRSPALTKNNRYYEYSTIDCKDYVTVRLNIYDSTYTVKSGLEDCRGESNHRNTAGVHIELTSEWLDFFFLDPADSSAPYRLSDNRLYVQAAGTVSFHARRPCATHTRTHI